MSELTIVQGTDQSYPQQITIDGSTPSTQFLNTDTLSGRVWPGGGQATLFTPTVTWIDASTAQFLITITAAQSTTLGPGKYSLQALATRSGVSIAIFDGSLKVTSAPGSTAALPVYTSYDDLVQYADWLEDLQTERDGYGFQREQGRARSWFDDMLVERWKWNSYAPMTGTPGYGSYSLYGGRDPFPSKWLRDTLALNTLIVRDQVRECLAKKAISYICARQIGKGDSARDYGRLARYFAREAEEIAKTLRAEIDINGDEYADLVINLGASDLR